MTATTLQVGPSGRMDDWQAFFYASRWRSEDFDALLAADGPGRALFTVETMINGLYWWAERARDVKHPDLQKVLDEVHFKTTWLSTKSREARHAMGPSQRELELGVLRWIRREACLTVVIGAGATMACGGPSWPALVRRLLLRTLDRGHEITAMRETRESTPELPAARSEVIAVKRLGRSGERRARGIVAAIDDKRADTELLGQGAQLCHSLRGQHLFTDITGVLYENDRQPSPVHRSIAELADPVDLHGPGRVGRYPGWESIITYNFDDLMGEALDARGLPRTAHVPQIKGNLIAAYQSERARKAAKDEVQLDIFHLHGYTPRRPLRITDIQFVFSSSQYRKVYRRSKRRSMLDHVFDRSLAQPVYHALYVGCSFEDPVMNQLLIDAAARLPGRYHYAIVEWKGRAPFEQSSAAEIAAASARYEAMGVRPIWYDRYEEIPDLIRRLA